MKQVEDLSWKSRLALDLLRTEVQELLQAPLAKPRQ
jgi:hypothetical protein